MKPYGSVLSFFYLFSLFVFGTSSPLSQSTTVTYQAHSFDDLGQWRQLIAKGSNFIKVDLRYTPPPVCQQQARVFNQDNRGCYLLSHDSPLPHEKYYTSYDIVAFVLDPSNQYLFPKTSRLYIYLDFKNNRDRYPLANLTQSDNLQKEYVTFFTTQLRGRNISNIELVYNGAYLDDRNKSYGWPRTYKFQNSDIELSTSCLYSSKAKCKNTEIINNMANPLPFVDPSLSVLRMCEVKYGKYINSSYPWVFYEPTDQRTIFQLVDTYLECGIEHAPGFSVSINIDPIQYDVFAGTRSGKAWNQKLFPDAKWAHAIPVSYANSTMNFITLYLTKEDRIMYTFSKGALDIPANSTGHAMKDVFNFGNITLSTPLPLSSLVPFAASPFQKLKTFTFSAGQKDYIFVTDFRGNTEVYQVDGQTLLPIANTTFAHKQSESVTLVNASIVTNNNFHIGNSQIGWVKLEFLQGYVSFRKTECTFWIQWWQLWFDPQGKFHSELLPVGEPTCAVYSPLSYPLPVDSATISIAPVSHNKSHGNSSFCANSTHAGLVVVSSHKNIYGGVLCVNAHTTEVKVCTDSACAQTQAQLQQSGSAKRPTLPALDVGTFPSLSLITIPTTGEIAALEVHGDGYCYNSDRNNKRATPTVCGASHTPVSSRYVLNYNYGTLKNWATHIFDKKGLITSCDGGIYHGVYDEGSLPSAFLMIDQKNKVRMIEAHSGFPSGGVDYAGCSYPIPFDGAMIDGIVLPPLSLMPGGKWEPSAAINKFVTPPNNYDKHGTTQSGEMKISDSICNMCKDRVQQWQTQFQTDYELMNTLAYKVSSMCTLGQLLIGDGTIAGCKNLIHLYFPALAVDLTRSILSPDNCLLLGVCSGNASSVLPDINSQVSRYEPKHPTYAHPGGEDYLDDAAGEEGTADTSEHARITRSAQVIERDDADEAAHRELMRVVTQAMKTHLLELIGL